MVSFGRSMDKSFEVKYNPYSQQLQTTPKQSKSRYDSINVMSEVEGMLSNASSADMA